MKIENAKLEDIKQIAYIESVCFPEKEAATLESFEERFKVFGENFLVAKVEDKIIGFINGNETSSITLPDIYYEKAELHDPNGIYMSVFGIDVLPEYQHRGVAQALMNSYIGLAKMKGKKGVILTCKDRLIGFYEQFGYMKLQDSASTHGGAKWNDMFLKF